VTFFNSADFFFNFCGFLLEILVICEDHAVYDSFFDENEVFIFEIFSKHNWDEILRLVVHNLSFIISFVIEMNRTDLNERDYLSIFL
jgi:hypothetical protein